MIEPKPPYEGPKPMPPAIFAHLSERQLGELVCSYLFQQMKQADRVLRALEVHAKHLDSIDDAIGAIADLVDTIQIPPMLRKKVK